MITRHLMVMPRCDNAEAAASLRWCAEDANLLLSAGVDRVDVWPILRVDLNHLVNQLAQLRSNAGAGRPPARATRW